MTQEEIDYFQKAQENGVSVSTYFVRLVKGWTPQEACRKITISMRNRERIEKELGNNDDL